MVTGFFQPLTIFLLGLGGGFLIPLLYRVAKPLPAAAFLVALIGMFAVSAVNLWTLLHGAPPIEVAVKRAAEGIEVSVRDHGSGIPEADRERVFEPFFRRAGASQAGGAGLGLALVRQIAERHGGKARCEAPSTGPGSRFCVLLRS